MSTARSEAEAALCTQCGLCCSGAIYDYGLLDDAEVAQVTALGAPLWQGAQQAIALPCHFLEARRCTIYADRPGFCRAYRCKLLNKAGAEMVDRAEAETVIAKAHALTEAVTALLPPQENIATMRKRWSVNPDFWREAPPAEQPALLQLIMALAALNLHLDRHFRHADQEVIR